MLTENLYQDFIRWIREDNPHFDLTSDIIIPSNSVVKASVLSKSRAMTACVEEVIEVLKRLDIKTLNYIPSGKLIKENDVVLTLQGNAKKILGIERTLLNLLTYLFGIAYSTHILINKVKKINPKIKVSATRKVIPGLRTLAKKAVLIGGGDTHRLSLSDAIIIKDNHIAIIGEAEKTIEMIKGKSSFIHKIEVEVDNVEDAIKVAEAGVDIIMLDNMSIKEIKETLRILKNKGLRDKVIIEVSGGITVKNIEKYAELDVDIISTSVITMHPYKVDLSMEITEIIEK